MKKCLVIGVYFTFLSMGNEHFFYIKDEVK